MTRMFLVGLVLACFTAGWAAELPISDVVVFSSGVAYVQRAGTVKDSAAVQLSFKPEQINDLLKSMVLLDLDGGQVGTVTYGAKDPVSKTLQAFAVNINDNPTLADLLNRMRGVLIETNVPNYQGKILGVEKKTRVIDKETVVIDVLNLLTDEGIVSVRLEEVSGIRVLDERLNKELQEALLVVASGLNTQRKPVMITFTGKGDRRVVVGYIMEAPIWKTSYRLVLGETKNLLQGWAVVENTSDDDWTNVRLSLVSGRPISFIQDLYTPLYVSRPVVQPKLLTSIRPVEYDAEITASGKPAPTPSVPGTPPSPTNILGYLDVNGCVAGDAQNVELLGGWGTVDGQNIAASVTSAATATDLGRSFRYAINDPVTLPRQQSALLPIVTGGVDAWRVSIYNPRVHATYPLYGLRVKNTTGVHLMGGPITIYDGAVYAGDATFEDLQPGEQRLVSYAVDLGSTVVVEDAPQVQEILSLRIVKGVLNVKRKHRRTVTYTIQAKDGKERKMLVEHAFIAGWDLVEPKEPDEKTKDLYRFAVNVPAEKAAKLNVVEEYTSLDGTVITDMNTTTLQAYIQNGKPSPQVRAALDRVVEMQQRVMELQRKRGVAEQEIRTISTEQERLRANMNVLARDSDLYKQYVTKLRNQETRIEELREQIAEYQQREIDLRREIEAYVAGLNLE